MTRFSHISPRKIILSLSVSILALTGCTPSDHGHSHSHDAPSYLTEAPGAGKLTPEIINSVALNGSSLRRAAISPDGSMVTVLQGQKDNPGQQDLWAYDLETGKGKRLVSSTDLLGSEPEVLSEEEKNRRERAREYGSGIVAYTWIDKDHILFPLGGDIFLYNIRDKSTKRVTETDGFETDPKVSRSGDYVAYVRGNELFVKDLETDKETQLSSGATDLIRNGIASFVVQEELARSTGYWWSPKEDRLAYTQIDESPVAIENRIDFGADGVKNISQRYPFAGTDNATVKLGIVPRTGGKTIWADIGDNPDIYLTRVTWSADGKSLYAGILSRNHKSHKILKINPDTGASKLLFEETSPTWLNIRTGFRRLKQGGIMFTAEQSDLRQVFTLSDEGKLTAITPDTMRVAGINCVNETDGKLYVTGWKDSPLERHVFSINMDGSDLTQITQGEGRHSARFAGNCSRYIGTFSNPNTPFQTRAFDNTGKGLAWLNENKLDETHPYAPYKDAHIEVEYGQIKANDGTPLDYMLYKPLDLKAGEKRPSVTLVYGGPGVQRVHKGWERKHFARMLAHHGFVVFQLDNRGAANRGKKFEDHLYRAMGKAEVVDQTTGAEWLKKQDFIDPNNMGVYGWSYGGYMTLHMLAQTDLYKSGVSGAPVTDWALYDTAYTERFLGDPRPDNSNYTKGAYEDGAVFAHLDGLTEPVLLIHGMADDNVVFRHAVKLMDAMQKNGQHNLRIMTYPGEKHGFRAKENRTHRDRQILEFFLETLGPDGQ